MAFAAGALVFPGGRIDPDDHETAAGFALPDAAARIAAIRETIEETGLAIGLRPAPDAAAADALRDGIMRGEPFALLLAAQGLALDLDALTPFARWCPNFRETRRFDTLFFLAEAPPDAPAPVAGEAEAVRAFWASAADILAEVEAGEAHVIFPTRRNLERLAALRLDRRGARRCGAPSGDAHHALGRGARRRAPCLHPRGHRLSGHLRAAGDGAAALRPACAPPARPSRSPARRAGGGRPDRPRLCPPSSRGRALDRARSAPADRRLHRPQAQCAGRGCRALPGLADRGRRALHGAAAAQ